MSILSNIGAINAVAEGVTGLVRELRRPRASAAQQDFASQLRREVARAEQDAHTRALDTGERAAELSREFVLSRDLDGNSKLTQAESGLGDRSFAVMDADGDGVLTSGELFEPVYAYLSAQQKAAHD